MDYRLKVIIRAAFAISVFLCFFSFISMLRRHTEEVYKSHEIQLYHMANINRIITERTPDTISYKYWSNVCDSLDRKIHD